MQDLGLDSIGTVINNRVLRMGRMVVMWQGAGQLRTMKIINDASRRIYLSPEVSVMAELSFPLWILN